MILLRFCLILSVISFALSAEEHLTPENFESSVKEFKVALVNYYADWCHFCREFAPAYHAAAEELEPMKLSKTALIAKMDCVAHADLCQMHGVNKYPTLKLYREGVLQKREYRGQRTKEAVVDYIKSQLTDAYKKVDTNVKELTQIKTGFDEAHVLGVFSAMQPSNAEFAMFSRVASSLSETCTFFAVEGAPEGLYFRHHDVWDDVPKPLSIGLLSLEEAVKQVSVHCKPKVRELTFSNAEEITEENIPLFILFYKPGDNTARQEFTNYVLQHLATEDSVNFVTASGETFSHPLAHLGLTLDNLPVVVIDSFQHMYQFKRSLSDAYKDPKLFRQFIDDLHSGQLHYRLHWGGPDQAANNNKPQEPPQEVTEPPKSVFKKLQPNSNRYSMHDEF